MIKLESFFIDGKIPSYNQVWRHALRMLQDYISNNKDTDWPPADDEGDYFNAALDNVVWLRDMANIGDKLNDDEYKQWWIDFIACVVFNKADADIKYPEGGCDGEIRYDYMIDDDNLLG